jgi:thiosulfate/3-mercaptopyruvate sulfurtransferase
MHLPLVTDPAEIKAAKGVVSLRLVDVRKDESRETGHLEGAVAVNPALLNRSDPPVAGLLPDMVSINRLLADLGIHPGEHLVVYDDGAPGSNSAARLIWVLHAYGYTSCSWLNGGMNAWRAAGLPVVSGPLHNDTVATSHAGASTNACLKLTPHGENLLTCDDLLGMLSDSTVAVLDVRTAGEYAGTNVRAKMGGRVPGARHYEWSRALDEHGRLRHDAELSSELEALGITPDKTIVVYCQSHQRSSLTYVMLKHLGFKDVRALDGAWSSWGNRDDTPKETTIG